MTLHRKLRGRMAEMDMDLAHMARTIRRGRSASSARLNGHESWCLDEVYALCRELDIPVEQIADYFPEGGKERRKPNA